MGENNHSVPRSLTDKERKVLETLAQAFEQFKKLPVKHPMDTGEFVTAIHSAQLLILARPVRDEIFSMSATEEFKFGETMGERMIPK